MTRGMDEQGARPRCRATRNWLGALAVILAAGRGVPARAATITVTTTLDQNSSSPADLVCSLREALIAANSNVGVGACAAGSRGLDTILLAAGTYELSIAGADENLSETGDLDVLESVEIVGAGSSSTTIDANGIDILLNVPAGGVSLTVRNVTLRGGERAPYWLTDGSAIRIEGQLVSLPGPPGQFFYCPGCTLLLEDSVVTGNGSGAAIGLIGYASATIRRTSVSSNSGGGISLVAAEGVLEDTTVAANAGDGILVGGGSATLERSTVSGNGGNGVAGAILLLGQVLDCGEWALRNTTVSGNGGVGALEDDYPPSPMCSATADNTTIVGGAGTGAALSGSVTLTNALVVGSCSTPLSQPSNGGNVESPGNTCGLAGPGDQVNVADPKLGPLAMNGGLTKTHALVAGSPAIGRGNDAACLATDQRGVARPAPAGGHCDVGSYEYDTGCGASLELAGAAPVALLVARRRRRASAG